MGFRTLDINNAAEMHIKNAQLEITNEKGVALIPIDDLSLIMAHGANIRLSTIDISIFAQNKIALITFDD